MAPDRLTQHRTRYTPQRQEVVNGCENFFNCFRRACKGTYFKPTQEHLSAYVDEAVFRFNVRHLTEWERSEKAMRLIVVKRLTYSELTHGATR